MHRSSKIITLQVAHLYVAVKENRTLSGADLIEDLAHPSDAEKTTAEAKARFDKLLTSMTVEQRRAVVEQITDDDQALQERPEDMDDSHGTIGKKV